MLRLPRPDVSFQPARLLALAALSVLPCLAGCGPQASAPTATAGRSPAAAGAPVEASAPGSPAVDGAAAVPTPEVPRSRSGHDWFPLTPGRYVDYRIYRFAEANPVSYVRVTAGRPETFFGRTATPFVYGPVPGRAPDFEFDGLRQYWSVNEDGALQFHGAQNEGFMSYTEPPVRRLPADPQTGDTWQDQVIFRSFLPGMDPFYTAEETHTVTLSNPAFLTLAGLRVHALRSSVVIDGTPVRALLGAAATTGAGAGAGRSAIARDRDAVAARFAAHGVAARPDAPEAIKGLWFARERGMVARDWPPGPGPENINVLTFEWIGSGWGPVPPASPVP